MRETVEVAEEDADRPLSHASLELKFSNFAIPVLGDESAKRIASLVDNLDVLQDVRALTAALRGKGKQEPT